MPNATVRPVHFEDLSGADFERLVFAFHLRAGWTDLAWYGQTGSDLGRDIIGTQLFDNRQDRRTVIQCVNRAVFTQAKALHDMNAAANAPTGKPDAFKFVCRAAVSANMRDKIAAIAKHLGIPDVTVWSGVEFEEELRLRAQFLLQRFVSGEQFPDSADELGRFADDFPAMPDSDILALMAAVFERPAFQTPFVSESYLPAFQQALDDTIRALNTGVWQTREGTEIRRIPSVHHLTQPANRSGVAKVVREVDEVRRLFKELLIDGRIRHCGCSDPNCPTFMISNGAAHIDRYLFGALGVHQGDVQAFFEAVEEWGDDDKIRVIIAVSEAGYRFDLGRDDPSRIDLDLYECDSLRDLAMQFIDDGLFGKIPASIANYLDYDAIARDLSMDYAETTIDGARYIYRCG